MLSGYSRIHTLVPPSVALPFVLARAPIYIAASNLLNSLALRLIFTASGNKKTSPRFTLSINILPDKPKRRKQTEKHNIRNKSMGITLWLSTLGLFLKKQNEKKTKKEKGQGKGSESVYVRVVNLLKKTVFANYEYIELGCMEQEKDLV